MARGLIQRAHLKRGIIITPKDHWPRFDGGVSMANSGMQPDGRTLYTYVYSMNYQVRGKLHAVMRVIDKR